MNIVAGLIVIILCGGSALLSLLLVRSKKERIILVRLFTVAFLLRIGFTIFSYRTGIIGLLGGMDDSVWEACWGRSRQWKMSSPDPIWSIYLEEARRNSGFLYFGTWFYYLLDIRSQEALAFFNCFVNSLTVVVIFKTAKQFFSEKASLMAAWVAAFLPGFLIWSALTLKETWLIFLELMVFYTVILFCKEHKHLKGKRFSYLFLAFILLVLILPLRFYVFYYLSAGVLITIASYGTRRPFRAVALTLTGLLVFSFILSSLRIVRFDPLSVAQSQMEQVAYFRDSIADPRFGGRSSVKLDYDLKTPSGVVMMALVGGIYVLLSPFPWQLFNGRQIFALPDVAIWWVLLFAFIIPGMRYARHKQPALLISIAAFVLPLLLFYSLIFGNVGLAYRQRAQLMPFLLILAAAGYESRQRVTRRDTTRTIRQSMRRILVQHLREALLQKPGNLGAVRLNESKVGHEISAKGDP